MEKASPKPIVHILKFSPHSIVADVKGQDIKIENLGTERFFYRCSCGVWHADVKRGSLPYCVHYLYVLAELIRQGLVTRTKTKLNKLDYNGLNRIASLIAEISSYEDAVQDFREGKILLCKSCLNSYLGSPLMLVSIDRVAETTSGFSIEGTGVCGNDGSFVNLRRDVEIDLEDVECPTCRKRDCKLSLKIDSVQDGYRFVLILECKTRKCVWKKDFTSEIQSASEIFARAKKLCISQGELRIERDGAEGLFISG